MTHAQLVERAARWLEKTRGCSLVLTEFVSCALETPDAIGWRVNQAWSVLVECKTTRSDFQRDKLKPFRQHRALSLGQERWFMAPPGVILPADVPEGWGLLVAGKGIQIAVRCPDGPQEGSRYSRGLLDKEVQANELALLLSVYRRKKCASCAREMYRGGGGLLDLLLGSVSSGGEVAEDPETAGEEREEQSGDRAPPTMVEEG